MGTKFLKEGEDFSFPESFGFKGSVNPRNHPTRDEDEFGDGTYLAQQAQEPTYARGGSVHGTVPVHKAATAVLGALQVGKQIGQKMAATGAGMAPHAPTITQGPIPASMMGSPPGGVPAMAHGGEVECRADGGIVPHGGDHQYDADAESAKAQPHDPIEPHMAKGGHFIAGAIKHPGALHEDLHVPKGQKIPEAKLEAAAKKSGKVGQRARFAETLRGLNHKEK